jgi:hypothetical protein
MTTTMLPAIDFCGVQVTRLIMGANPFGGYSHQNDIRDEQMRGYYTVARIKETWQQAQDAGINTMVTNNETPHVVQAASEYLGSGGALNWIAQVTDRSSSSMEEAIDRVVDSGCAALYFHGALIDKAFVETDDRTVSRWCDHARSRGVPVGVAAHAPQAHLWVDGLDVVDFHAVCFFNCGSLHNGEGSKFKLADVDPAAACARRIKKPCIAYKIMGAGRIDARMAFEYAFESIKPTDAVNVGMFRGDNDDMVAQNSAMVREILG